MSIKEGFNPSSEEAPLRLTTKVEEKAESKENFCNYCAVLDPRLSHKEVMEIPFQIGEFSSEGDNAGRQKIFTVEHRNFSSFCCFPGSNSAKPRVSVGCSDSVCVSDLTIAADLDEHFFAPYVIGSSGMVDT